MDNSYRLSITSVFILFLSCPFIGGNAFFAQSTLGPPKQGPGIRIVKTNWSGTMECTGIPPANPQCVELGSDNILLFKLIVRVAEPDVSACEPIYFYYYIPNNFAIGYPNPSIPNAPGTPYSGFVGPVTNDMLEQVTLEDGEIGWQAVFPFYVDFSDECIPAPNGTYDNFYFEVNYWLAAHNPDDPSWYPYIYYDCDGLFPIDRFNTPMMADKHTEGKIICCSGEGDPCGDSLPNPRTAENNDEAAGIDKSSTTANAFTSFASIFPTPFSEEVIFKFDTTEKSETIQVEVYNSQGVKIKVAEKINLQSNGHTSSINTSSWPPGIYYFQFTADQKTQVLKSIKQ